MGKRAQFVGIEAYEAEDGAILRDLFQADDGGWLQDPAVLDRLVAEKLDREAEAVRVEGWKWVEVAPDFPYGHTYGLRRLLGETAALTDDEAAEREKLRSEFDELEATHAQDEELPEEVDQRLGEIEAALEAFENRLVIFDPEDVARAGAFVSINGSGKLRVERGYVRPEDELAVAGGDAAGSDAAEPGDPESRTAVAEPGGDAPASEADEDDGVRPLPDRLVTELTAHRTLALRDGVASDPHVAFVAALHALCLKLFYRYGLDSCLEIESKSTVFGAQAPGLADTASAKAIEARHEAWLKALPKEPGELWDALVAFDGDSRQALFAHCVSLTVNAVHDTYNRRPKAIAHADRIAEAVGLDMAAVGWQPTVETYLGRVTKARILEALREARGETAAEHIAHLKKAEMAKAAEELLAGSKWVPEPLRTPGQVFEPAADVDRGVVTDGEGESAPNGGEPAMDADRTMADPDEVLPAAQGIAAE